MLELFTSEPGVQLFSGNHLNDISDAECSYPRHGGLCLETLHFPDSPNQPQFPSVIVRPREKWTSATTWRFRRIV